MVSYTAFVPKQISRSLFGCTYEDLNAALKAANDWIAGNRVQVMNIETILVPDCTTLETGGTVLSHFYASDPYHLRQFIRVWYQQWSWPASPKV